MHYRIFFGLTITFYVYYVILFISIEHDWCANYDKEKDNYEKIQLLTKQKQYRQTIIERLRKIRIQEEEQERHEEEELMRKRLHDDNNSIHSEDTGNEDITDDSEYELSNTTTKTNRISPSGFETSNNTREKQKLKAKRLALRKRKRHALQESTSQKHNEVITKHGDDEWLVDEYHSLSDDSDTDNNSVTSRRSHSKQYTKNKNKEKISSNKGFDTLPSSEAAQHTINLADQIRAQLLKETTTTAISTPSTKSNKAKSLYNYNTNEYNYDPYQDILQKEEENSFRPKILFVSRTHSQISQFVREISKTIFGKDARVVVLGSRRNLCINPDVLSLSSDSRINERCLELQDQAKAQQTKKDKDNIGTVDNSTSTVNKKLHIDTSSIAPPFSSPATNSLRIQYVDNRGKVIEGPIDDDSHISHSKSSKGGCPYLDPDEQSSYSDRLLARLRDVEDAAEIGWDMGTCAYYGSRAAIKHAEIIAMPYSMLLHAGTRQSSGITVDGNVIIIDEAHNIIDAINNTHATTVTITQLTIACQMVRAYIQKYSNRMKGSNLAYCTQLANIFEALSIFLKSPYNIKPIPSIITPSSSLSVNNPNLPPGSSPATTTATTTILQDKLSIDNTHRNTSNPTTSILVNTNPSVPLRSSSPISSFWGTPVGKNNNTTSTISSSNYDTNSISNHMINELTLAPITTSQLATIDNGGLIRSRTSSISSESYLSNHLSNIPVIRSTTPTLSTHHHPNNTNGISNNTNTTIPNGLHTVSDFLATAGLLNINLFHLRRYVDTVELLRKLRGFAEAGARAAVTALGGNTYGNNDTNIINNLPWMNIVPGEVMIHNSTLRSNKTHASNTSNIPSPNISSSSTSTSTTPSYMVAVAALQASYSFLLSLMNADKDGRIIVTRQSSSSTSNNTNNHHDHHQSNSTNTSTTSSTTSEPHYKFILLNPAVPFEDIVSRARSVILVGGTMQPMNDIVQQLFGHLPQEKVTTFSCGHIIPKDNLAVFTVNKGPTGVTLDFRHALRTSSSIMDELGRCLTNIVTIVPGGIVVFLPSFDYLRTLLNHWNKDNTNNNKSINTSTTNNSNNNNTLFDNLGNDDNYILQGNTGSILAQLNKRKYVFAEPRTSNQVEQVLRAYTTAIQQGKQTSLLSTSTPVKHSVQDIDNTDTYDNSSRSSYSSVLSSKSYSNHDNGSINTTTNTNQIRFPTTMNSTSTTSVSTTLAIPTQPTGALLFCVVGGKMSEGINFSDDLARCVIVVGLPYPNPSDPELMERMNYLDTRNSISSNNITTSTMNISNNAMNNINNNNATTAGREYYENITMRAVNQAIGRSIRHVNDYATILLFDTRYNNQRVRSKLPGWINDTIITNNNHDNNNSNNNNWGTVISGLGTFFRRKREQK